MNLKDAPRYMTYQDYADTIDKVTYRPGWKLSVFNDPWEGPCLMVVTEVPDGYNPSSKVVLRIRSVVPPQKSAADFLNWLLWRLMQIELHECREYFHLNGKPWVDPHDPIEPYDE